MQQQGIQQLQPNLKKISLNSLITKTNSTGIVRNVTASALTTAPSAIESGKAIINRITLQGNFISQKSVNGAQKPTTMGAHANNTGAKTIIREIFKIVKHMLLEPNCPPGHIKRLSP